MKKLSQTIFDNYQIRKTKKQKSDFINFYASELNKLNIPYTIETGGIFKSRNIVIGDIKKAQFVYTAHYDTAPKRILPLPYTLVFPNKAILSSLVDLILIILPLLISYLIFKVFKLPVYIYLIGITVYIYLTLFLSLFGKANPHTANDNTSGVIALTETLIQLKDEDAAFILFDNEEKGLFGSRYFNKKNKNLMNNKIVVNLDCISDGDHILVLHSPSLTHNKILFETLSTVFENSYPNKHVEIQESKFYPSDHVNFKFYVAIMAANKSKYFSYYLDKIHTSKDIVFDKDNLKLISESLIKLNKIEANVLSHNPMFVFTGKFKKVLIYILLIIIFILFWDLFMNFIMNNL